MAAARPLITAAATGTKGTRNKAGRERGSAARGGVDPLGAPARGRGLGLRRIRGQARAEQC